MADGGRRLCPLPQSAKLKGHRLFSEVLATLNNQHVGDSRIGDFEKEESENILERVSLRKQTSNWVGARQNDLVYEDHFNPSILARARKGEFCYQKLIDVCKKYENRAQVDEHGRKCDETYQSFVKTMSSADEAKASAFAIAFYTGSHSGGISRGASIIARESNGDASIKIDDGHLDDASIILYYLVKGISNIPYYWGVSARAIDLNDEESTSYSPGNLVTWFQFSSSKRGYDPPKAFQDRNTYFIIYSLTGRPIKRFSSFPEEDEILFLPHSTFLVLDKKIKSERSFIYLRQVELGFSEWSILWVDDHILDPSWENKEHMERAATRAMNRNVHFIPRSTTENGLSFLRSPFGCRLKGCSNFRIVSDMKRENETSSRYAGTHLIKEVRRLGFNNRILIFTGNKSRALEKIHERLNENESKNVSVTESSGDLDRFVGFED